MTIDELISKLETVNNIMDKAIKELEDPLKLDNSMPSGEYISNLNNYKEALLTNKIALATLKAHKQGHHYRDEQGRYVITELDEIIK